MIKPRMLKWAGHIVCIGEMRNMYKILVGEPEGKTPFIIPRYRREDNVRLGFWKL
jgi:hypothetical protein